MPAFLTPIIAGFLTALGALLIRYIEKKILKVDADKTAASITAAKDVAKNPVTIDHLMNAEASNNRVQANLNMKFATKAKAIIFFFLLSYSFCQAAITAPRTETKITQSNDTIYFTFTIYNTGADTAFISSLLITTVGNYSICDSGYAITTTTPTITDTSLHPTVAPYTLANKGIYQFVYNFKAHNRLISPPGTATEVGTAALIIPNRSTTCPIYILYSTPNTPSFIGYGTTQTNTATLNSSWYLFFQD